MSAVPSTRASATLVLALLPQATSEVVPGDAFDRLDERVRAALARASDPPASGWESEVLAEATGRQLAALARHLEGAEAALADGVLAADFAAEFAGSAAQVFADRAFRVARPALATDPAELDRDTFLAELSGPFQGAREVRARCDTLRVERGEHGLVTEVVVRVSGTTSGGAIQTTAWWRCVWAEDAAGTAPPALARVHVLEHEEATTSGPPALVDATAAVLGANATWSTQLVPGLDAWRARLDTRLGLSLTGSETGLAIGDVDGDGLEDLYLCQPGGLPNLLFVHRPDGTALDRSADAGVDFLDASRAALLVDLDGDADRDLAVSAGARLLLLANNGKGHFWLEAAHDAPDAAALAAADVDLDGDLDLHVTAYASPCDGAVPPVPYHDAQGERPDLLLENRGDWLFTNATGERGLGGSRSGRAAAFEDYDLDGDPDLLVADGFGRAGLYRNDGGTFTDVAAGANVRDVPGETGVAWGDFDGDGRFDALVSGAASPAGDRVTSQARFLEGASPELSALYRRHAGGTTLLRNRGDAFEVASGTSPLGPSPRRWTSGALFADLNADGWQDVLAPGGFLTGELGEDRASSFWREVVARSPVVEDADADAYAAAWAAHLKLLRRGGSWSGSETGSAFLNLAGRGFADVSSVAGFALAADARAAALVDWDGDGDQDVVLTSRTGPRVRFLRNDQATGNAHVTLELRGTRANRDAIGARVEVVLAPERPGAAERTLVRGVRAGEGGSAQSSTRVTLGLGARGRIARVRVAWPGGTAEEFTGVEPGRAWRLVEGAGRAEPLALARPAAQPATVAEAAPDAPPASEPASAARIPLVRPVPLPRLGLVADDGSALALFGVQPGGTGTGTGKLVALHLFSTASAACGRELADLARRADELEAAGLAPLALSVELAEDRARAEEFLAGLAWPFPWAVAASETLEILDALHCLLLDRERRLPLPATFLVDAHGALRVLYLGPVTADVLLADRALCDLGDGALLDAAVPFPGRWMFPVLPADADFLEGRLRARGLEAASREYARGRIAVVRSAPADLLQEFGRRAASEGRIAEAEEHFRRALAVDPRHFGALSDLAVLVHRESRFAEASELYTRALTLRPDHADTRFHLALARIALDDRAGAEQGLRWLRARGAEQAGRLEEVLAETAPR